MVHAHWKDAFSVDIVSIDRQHQNLVEKLNSLFESLASQESPACRLAAFDAFAQEVVDHFAHEERIMANIGFRDLEHHRRQHQALLAEATTLRSQIESAQTLNLEAVREFLTYWLVRHMAQEDSKILKHMRGQPY